MRAGDRPTARGRGSAPGLPGAAALIALMAWAGVGPLRSQTAMSDAELRAASVQILREVLSQAPVELGECAAAGLADPGIPEGEGLLEEALAIPQAPVRLAAIDGLRRLGSPAALPAIERELHARTWRIRREALRDLARIAGPEAVPTLREYLLSGRQPVSVRAAAADALGIVKDAGSANDLLDLLAHENPELRRHCLLALGEIRRPGMAEPLLEILEETEDEWDRALIQRALALSGNREGISAVVAMLTAVNPRLRALGRDTLLNWNRTSAVATFRRTVRQAGGPARLELILALVAEQDGDSVPVLQELLESETAYDREVAAAALARFGDRSGYPILREFLRLGEWRAGDPVRKLLSGVRDPSIANLLADRFRLGDLAERVWAASLLIRFQAPFARRFLERVARDEDSPYRETAVAALVEAGDRTGLEIVAERLHAPCADSPNPAVKQLLSAPRRETAEFLGEIFPTAAGVARVNIAVVLLKVLEAGPLPSPPDPARPENQETPNS